MGVFFPIGGDLAAIAMSKVALRPTRWLLWAVSVKYKYGAEHLLPSREKVTLYIYYTLCCPYHTFVQKVLR
jgi:hypothetical protein